MITYRPVPALTLGASNSWRSVLAAVVMAALLGTAAFETVAPEATPAASATAGAVAGATTDAAGPNSS
jgi:hypothetical protein